jgi:hypothetical protein
MIRFWNVHCSGCRCKGPEAPTPDEAIDKWNTILTKAEKQRQMILSMAKPKNDPKLTQKLWKAIRMKNLFTVTEIARLAKTHEGTVGNYVRLLKKNGFVRMYKRKSDNTKVWLCLKSTQVNAPTWTELLTQNDEGDQRRKHQQLKPIRVQARKTG